MTPDEYTRDGYTISTDRARLDIGLIHAFLSESAYWAQGRSLDIVRKTIQNSLCFGLYEGEQQVGFARVVTDYATFGWLCDVFVIESHRGRGLSKWLVECIASHPELSGLRTLMLATRDAHGLYERYGGFQRLTEAERWMVRRKNT
jgi:GNAT superfamily N-acetyltransferase